MKPLPPICHPRAVLRRKTARWRRWGAGLLIFSCVTFAADPSRRLAADKLDPFPDPGPGIHQVNDAVKSFLAGEKISHHEVLVFSSTPHLHYQAAFFLDSAARLERLVADWNAQEGNWNAPHVHATLHRPMPNAAVIAIETNRVLTHELTFYAPAPEGRVMRNAVATKPRIAIVIDDLGGYWHPVEHLLQLDSQAALTFAVLPETPYARKTVDAARAQGRDVLLHMPMEPLEKDEMNLPGYLTTAMTDAQITAQLNDDLQRLPGVIGINNHMGSRFTQDERAMKTVIAVLQARNLFFLDSRTNNATVGFRSAQMAHLPSVMRDVFLDHDAKPEAIARQFKLLRQIARRKGSAVAIGHPNRTTLKVLERELKNLRNEGFELVPVSRLVPPAGLLQAQHAASTDG